MWKYGAISSWSDNRGPASLVVAVRYMFYCGIRTALPGQLFNVDGNRGGFKINTARVAARSLDLVVMILALGSGDFVEVSTVSSKKRTDSENVTTIIWVRHLTKFRQGNRDKSAVIKQRTGSRGR